MQRGGRGSSVGDLVRGALAGAVATWVMDLVTTALLEGQSAEVAECEKAARPNGQTAIANLLDRIERQVGLRLDDAQRPMASAASSATPSSAS